MDPERWKQIDNLLGLASERPDGERDAFLRQSCAGDAELEREVRSLLTSQQKAERFLESPAIAVAALALAQHQKTGPPDTQNLPAGLTVSHYQIQRKLGGGGMGVVYQAEDTRLERHVALKFLSGELARDPQAMHRFLREARAASALNHPNIVTVYDVGTTGSDGGSIDFIAMEFLQGNSLDQLVTGRGLPLAELLGYATQIAGALAAAHAAGIVHRDLKPANLMITGSGCVKVLDFGLAKIGRQTEGLETDQGLIRGTASYMSPEQAEGKKVDARSDIFSFGVVLYEMITGGQAFGGDSVASILSAILRDDPRPPSEVRPGLPRELDRIVARCLQKDPDRRYQHAGDLKIDLQQILSNRPRRLLRPLWLLAGVAACIAVLLAAVWWLHRPPAAPVSWKLTRLTNEGGLSGSPALSPDGKLVAYSSDRGLDNGQDLYVQEVASGQTIRLTSDGVGNTTPDFSPDGTRIVFRSNRDGGGIYIVPAFGGEARLLAKDGLDPRFSPDGSLVAYWVGAPVAMQIPGTGAVWVVPSAGGQPQRVAPNFSVARYPIWSKDGKHLLLIGYASAKVYERSGLDWWLAGINDDRGLVKSGAFDSLVNSGLITSASANIPVPECWRETGNQVVFSDQAAQGAFYVSGRGTVNLWELGISPETGKVNGIPARLTTSAGNETEPSCAAGGAIAFTNLEPGNHIGSLPFDLDNGTAGGPLERLTSDPIFRDDVTMPTAGRYLFFVSNQLSKQRNLWSRDLATGKEASVVNLPFSLRYPAISPSADRIAFSGVEKDGRTVYVSSPGGTPEKVCEGCIRATDWSRDESKLLVFLDAPYQVNLLDVASHRQTPLLKHPTWSLLFARFSPDNRWVSFTIRTEPNRARIAIAPVDGSVPVPESAWIPIATVDPQDWANWSPDGNTLYYTSNVDGHICFWGQRLDARSRKPVGNPFSVLHLHGRVAYRKRGWSAAAGRLVMPLVEETGSIWMMTPTGGR